MKPSIKTLPDGRFQVRYWHPLEKRYVRAIKTTKEEAEQAAAAVKDVVRMEGYASLLTPEQAREYRTCSSLLPEGVKLLEVVDFYLKARPQAVVKKPIDEALEEYLQQLSVAVSPGHYDGVQRILWRWAAEAGPTRPLSSVTTAELRRYIEGLECAENTRGSVRRKLNALFTWAHRREYTSENPVERIEAISVNRSTPEFFTNEDTKKFLEAVLKHDPELLWPICLSLFAGLRSSEAVALLRNHPEDIRVKEKAVYLAEDVVKGDGDGTARPRLLEGLPETFWAWVDYATKKGYDKEHSVSDYVPRRRSVYEAAEIEWVHSGLRKTFITNAAQVHGMAQVVEWAGHTSGRTTYTHYRGIVSRAKAEEFFCMIPEIMKKS